MCLYQMNKDIIIIIIIIIIIDPLEAEMEGTWIIVK